MVKCRTEKIISEIIKEAHEDIQNYLRDCLSDNLDYGMSQLKLQLVLTHIRNNKYNCTIQEDGNSKLNIFVEYESKEFAVEIFQRLVVSFYDEGFKCSIIESNGLEVQKCEIVLNL